jgi:hypothetical protein
VIFKPEMVEKILAGEKTVTRRPVKESPRFSGGIGGPRWLPCKYEVGKDYAVQPGRGQKAVARIRILDVSRSHVGAIGDADAECEGFEDRNDFRAYWRILYGHWDALQLVDRIEFQLLSGGGSK